MPILMPTPMPLSAFPLTSVPGSGNACHLIHPGAMAAIVFKTAALDGPGSDSQRLPPRLAARHEASKRQQIAYRNAKLPGEMCERRQRRKDFPQLDSADVCSCEVG